MVATVRKRMRLVLCLSAEIIAREESPKRQNAYVLTSFSNYPKKQQLLTTLGYLRKSASWLPPSRLLISTLSTFNRVTLPFPQPFTAGRWVKRTITNQNDDIGTVVWRKPGKRCNESRNLFSTLVYRFPFRRDSHAGNTQIPRDRIPERTLTSFSPTALQSHPSKLAWSQKPE